MIVATLLEPRTDAVVEAIAACDATADAFEIRLDALQEPLDAAQVRACTSKPLIATWRRPADGGLQAISDEARETLLRKCLDAGFEYADVELDVQTAIPPPRLLLSHHDVRATPSTASILRRAQATPEGAIFKMASRVRSFADRLQLLGAARALQRKARPFAIMGLGDFPRPLTHLLGAALIYGGGRSNAPGQPPHEQLHATLRHWGTPPPSPELFLVVGDPVDHSLSPRMHNAAFQRLGHPASYGALRVTNPTELQMLLEAAPPLGLGGLSITTPLKDAAYELCTTRSPQAQAARAVNCIRIESDTPIGHNTDGAAAAAIAKRLAGEQARVLLLGTGGAARALASQWDASRLTVAGRSPEALRALAKQFACRTIPLSLATEELPDHELVVNANRLQEPTTLDGYKGAVFDFHYGAQPTAWEAHAKRHGLTFAGGRELLLEQGILAFPIWTGRQAPTDVMRAAVEAQ